MVHLRELSTQQLCVFFKLVMLLILIGDVTWPGGWTLVMWQDGLVHIYYLWNLWIHKLLINKGFDIANVYVASCYLLKIVNLPLYILGPFHDQVCYEKGFFFQLTLMLWICELIIIITIYIVIFFYASSKHQPFIITAAIMKSSQSFRFI